MLNKIYTILFYAMIVTYGLLDDNQFNSELIFHSKAHFRRNSVRILQGMDRLLPLTVIRKKRPVETNTAAF